MSCVIPYEKSADAMKINSLIIFFFAVVHAPFTVQTNAKRAECSPFYFEDLSSNMCHACVYKLIGIFRSLPMTECSHLSHELCIHHTSISISIKIQKKKLTCYNIWMSKSNILLISWMMLNRVKKKESLLIYWAR